MEGSGFGFDEVVGNGELKLGHELASVVLAGARDLEADPFAEEAVDVLDEGGDLAHGVVGDARVLEEAFGEGELHAVVGLEDHDEVGIGIVPGVRGIGVEQGASDFSVAWSSGVSRRLGQEGGVEQLVDRVRALQRKCVAGPMDDDGGGGRGVVIGGSDQVGELAAEAVVLGEQLAGFAALFEDRLLPACAAALGLELPFEQMLDEPVETPAQGAALALRQVLDFLRDVFEVGFGGAAGPQQFGIVPRPFGEIDVVKRGGLHGSIMALTGVRLEGMRFAGVWMAAATVLGLAAQDTRTVVEPTFPPVCARLSAQLAAPGDETAYDTGRIQAALNGCVSGQAVELAADGPANAFLIAPITLPKGVTLTVDAGVTVYGSRNPHDYDASAAARVCGTITASGGGCVPLITANRADGAGIMGYGTIDGRGHLPMIVDGAATGTSWWDLARQAQAVSQNQNNPRMIQVSNTDGFTLYKITLRNSPNFHVAMGNDTNFTAWGVKIITPYDARNTDGIDPGYSQNVTITQCHISDGDDQVAVGGSSSPGASNLSVVNNWFGNGHGASVGSYTQNGVSNLLVDRVVFSGDAADTNANGLRIKSDISRGGLVENVTYSNICMRNVRNAIVIDPFYTAGAMGTLVPQYRNITLRNVNATTEGTVKIQGHDASVPTTITLDNVQVSGIRSADVAAQQYVNYTLGPGPVNFAALLTGTGVTVTDGVANADAPYACPAAVFSPIAGELIPGPREAAVADGLTVAAQVFATKAVPYQTYLNNRKTNPNATLELAAPTGTVTIYDGATAVGAASLDGSSLVTIRLAGLGPGVHTLTAAYSGDGNYAPFTFGSYTLAVCMPGRGAGCGGRKAMRPR